MKKITALFMLAMILLSAGCKKTSDPPQIVFEGDSLSVGTGGTHAPDYYVTLPLVNGQAFKKTNVAVYGKTMAEMSQQASKNIEPLYNPRAIMNVLVIWGCINDVRHRGGTPEACSATLADLAERERKQGWKVLVGTAIDWAGDPGSAQRNVLNGLIRQNWKTFADGLIDFSEDPNLDATGASGNLQYYQPDGVHLTDAGYIRVAKVEQAAITNLTNNIR